jgi:hypothetical protein
MKNKNSLAVIIGLLLFGGLITAAILLQSAYLLYAATAIPILLVPFIPDIKTSKTLKPGSSNSKIRMYRTDHPDGEGFLIIEADPGAIPWNKRRLYFPVTGIPVLADSSHTVNTAGIPILQYDLIKHRRKSNVYGIELANLAPRFRTLSYTADEVTRLIIRLEDIKPADDTPIGARPSALGKELQA